MEFDIYQASVEHFCLEKMGLLATLTFIVVVFPSLAEECPPHACLESQTCCAGIDSSEYGCCAIPDGICCPGGTYCCPKDSYCNELENTCILDDSNHVSPPFTKRLGELVETTHEDTAAGMHISEKSTDAVEDVNLCDDQHYCQNSMACCQTPDGKHSCCPFADGVCCPDMAHCCPRNQECDVSSKRCIERKTLHVVHKTHVNALE